MSRFCVHCGHEESVAGHASCTAERAVLEPPRFCPECARRMVVQVTPLGWTARCARHGEYTNEPTG
ncbi:biotin synthase auxiliary protein BsaP [Amycolatopsis pigmentata]|uniref:Biotin synthase auxiliary protein n=1 Tax=Amycolatopsis pigmentata TaxID=450801 RepID=A0ABW5FUF9_9PSEU